MAHNASSKINVLFYNGIVSDALVYLVNAEKSTLELRPPNIFIG